LCMPKVTCRPQPGRLSVAALAPRQPLPEGIPQPAAPAQTWPGRDPDAIQRARQIPASHAPASGPNRRKAPPHRPGGPVEAIIARSGNSFRARDTLMPMSLIRRRTAVTVT